MQTINVNKALPHIVHNGELDKAKKAISEGANINAVDEKNIMATRLHIAAEFVIPNFQHNDQSLFDVFASHNIPDTKRKEGENGRAIKGIIENDYLDPNSIKEFEKVFGHK